MGAREFKNPGTSVEIRSGSKRGVAMVELEFREAAKGGGHLLLKIEAGSGIGVNTVEPGDSCSVVDAKKVVLQEDTIGTKMRPDGVVIFDGAKWLGGFDKGVEFGGLVTFDWFGEVHAEEIGIGGDVDGGRDRVGRGVFWTGEELGGGVFGLDHGEESGNTIADRSSLGVRKFETDIAFVFLERFASFELGCRLSRLAEYVGLGGWFRGGGRRCVGSGKIDRHGGEGLGAWLRGCSYENGRRTEGGCWCDSDQIV